MAALAMRAPTVSMVCTSQPATAAAGLADCVESRQRRAAEIIGIDAADHVMRRGMDRDQIFRGIDFELFEQLGELREAFEKLGGGEMARVEIDVSVVGLADLLDDG